MPVPPKRTGPLAPLKVLEIGHYIAAPFCTASWPTSAPR
jgi:crotonobetainyl-CoA:carnitine CoA-transferase CaiB-like acyl-CoA transferase